MESSIVDVGSVVEAVGTSDAPLYQVESLCMSCGQNGITRFLLTIIPHFRQFAGEIQPKGCSYVLHVPAGDQKMFGRQVVKSESATIKIPELDFEIPPEAQRGSLSTVEGILVRAVDGLQALQEERKKVDPQTAESIDQFLVKLKACATGDLSFTFILDDPAGNSFIENPFAPAPDPSLTIKFYDRTPEQQASLGFLADISTTVETGDEAFERENINSGNEEEGEPHGSVGARAGRQAIAQGNSAKIAEALFRYSAPEEVMTFPSTCGACTTKCECRMFVTNIPYFQEVIVMASSCDACGYRNSEVKPGGPIPLKGKRIEVHVKNIMDLSRDVIKSDTASVKIPELDLELASGTLGGLVTTVEGLISQINDNLQRIHGFTFGDSLDDNRKSRWLNFRERLDKLLSLEEPWTLIIDDALANSFIAPAADDIKDDHQLTCKSLFHRSHSLGVLCFVAPWNCIEEYERSWEQNEELGLNDMDTSAADLAYDSAGAALDERTDS
ncbi:hypothetical protein LIER_08101 [Lithospermum erythrorhizon]|uniref:Zinc finger ZPR1-type domain-containing protein n=1 Tax=Lithospermum erythrorhizon TaxID=34254 RepID=A0AAV3PF12_LITER